ncbi:MAG: universal stress protein [Bacteroidales bacterium]|nr:universal stress protein [Bacteroidales bacterium]
MVKETYNTYKIKPHVIVKTGKVAREIKQVAHDLKAMLVIMKTAGGKKGYKRFFGSLSIKVMMGSDVPLL